MSTDNAIQETTENWIEHIVDKVKKYYGGRKVVLWGRYSVSEDISDKLRDKHGISVAFYVDADVNKIDQVKVFPTDCLYGKASEYYVVIPVAFYQSVKDKMSDGGYEKEVDYYYFCDCIIRDEEDYYEDTHGNKLIGKHYGLKFVFSGFNSRIEIGENVCFKNTTIYLHNDCQISIGNNICFRECIFHMSKPLEKHANNLSVCDCTSLEIKEGCSIQYCRALFKLDSKLYWERM